MPYFISSTSRVFYIPDEADISKLRQDLTEITEAFYLQNRQAILAEEARLAALAAQEEGGG